MRRTAPIRVRTHPFLVNGKWMHLTINIGGCVDERRRGRGTGRTMIERAHEALTRRSRGALRREARRRDRVRSGTESSRSCSLRYAAARVHAALARAGARG